MEMRVWIRAQLWDVLRKFARSMATRHINIRGTKDAAGQALFNQWEIHNVHKRATSLDEDIAPAHTSPKQRSSAKRAAPKRAVHADQLPPWVYPAQELWVNQISTWLDRPDQNLNRKNINQILKDLRSTPEWKRYAHIKFRGHDKGGTIRPPLIGGKVRTGAGEDSSWNPAGTRFSLMGTSTRTLKTRPSSRGFSGDDQEDDWDDEIAGGAGAGAGAGARGVLITNLGPKKRVRKSRKKRKSAAKK